MMRRASFSLTRSGTRLFDYPTRTTLRDGEHDTLHVPGRLTPTGRAQAFPR